jgi:hypothetical protein
MGLGLDWTLSDAEPDGTLDLWSLSDPSDGRVVTLPNTGTDFDTSSGTVVYGQGASLRSIVLSDITGDGVPDLVVSGTLGVHATDRGGGGDLGVIVTGPAYETLVVHGDSEPHLFVIANDVRYFLHSGFGSTTEVTTFPPAGSDLSSPLDAVLCDLEGDGDDDVVLLRASGSGDEIVVLRQTETGDLEIAARFDVAANANAVAAADLDGFGAPEIVVSRASTASIDVASIYDATTGAELVQLPTGDRVDVVTGNYDHEEPVDVAFVAADGSVDIWINQTR